MKLLLIEDDVLLARSLKYSLREWHIVDIAHTGEEGLYNAVNIIYDLVILDISLPDMNGIILCKEIRKTNPCIPVLFLTGHNTIEKKIEAFNCGADDYVTKPFEKKELLARIAAIMRRSDPRQMFKTVAVGEMIIDLENHRVHLKGQNIKLRRKEFEILVYMARHPGKAISRETLLTYLWGDETEFLANTIDVHINYLRDNLDKLDKPFGHHLIQTVHGIGYKLVTDDYSNKHERKEIKTYPKQVSTHF